MMKLAQAGLECHANYWVTCPAGPNGHWTANVHHILITVVVAIVAIYLLFKLFGITK